MKKLILAFVALALAFAISSCCDQSKCPGKKRCVDEEECGNRGSRPNNEDNYRFDKADQQKKAGSRYGQNENCPNNPPQERQHRKW